MTSADPLQAKLGSKARILLPIFLLSFLAISAWKMWPSPYGIAHRFHGETMGTTYNITVVSDALTSEERTRIEQELASELARIDLVMSTYRDDAQLAQFNAHAANQAFAVDPSLTDVLAIAHEVSEQSSGAFDVTVSPLVDLWGFGPGGKVEHQPTPTAIASAQASMGYTKLNLDIDAHTLMKTHAELKVELSSIAPGYAADQLSELLAKSGYANTMVEVGGEVFTRGHNQDGATWKIGIEQPLPTRQALHSLVGISGQGLATSGDYRNTTTLDGESFSHTIDPRTGRPIAHNLASVTVVASNAARADALATALLVLGPKDGLSWAKKHDLAALFLIR
ncbi:MAG: FAD:protein FMN transferase, partial [Nannocystaceae bacterium]